jgi:hypothetical protein
MGSVAGMRGVASRRGIYQQALTSGATGHGDEKPDFSP